MRSRAPARGTRGFRHEAFFYVDEAVYCESLTAFLLAGLEAGEPVMAIVPSARLGPLRAALGSDVEDVLLADMAEVGRNPARIIPEWRRFVDASGDRAMRGVCEPLWAGRGRQEAIECHRHEWLLPRAFAEDPLLWLVCPYDVAGLDAADVDLARRLHHALFDRTRLARTQEPNGAEGEQGAGGDALPAALLPEPFPADDALPEVPATTAVDLSFGNGDLAEVREKVGDASTAAGLEPYRAKELTLAVHEVASNVVRHTGGPGRLRLWRSQIGVEGPAAVICEVSDRGRAGGPIADPLVGRDRPHTGLDSGRGLWLANQLCDLVQLRTSATGTVVRMHVLLPG